MISPDEARKLVAENTSALPSEQLALNFALGRILAQPVVAPHNHPFFDQSAMDGYAVRWQDLAKFETLTVSEEIPAGKTALPQLNAGEAIRIFTGAAIPKNADTVVIQEHTQQDGNALKVIKYPPIGANIRREGDQIAKGKIALEAGHKLNAGSIGFLASIGVSQVVVSKAPRVAIVATGNEFLSIEEQLVPGKIFESNSSFLIAALKQEEVHSTAYQCADHAESLCGLLNELAQNNDVILVTGGVSVGDYDFTPEALQSAGFEIIFHKINQKPGKPLLFSKNAEGKLAFGLPGNPQSVLSCYYQYIIPAIRKMQGATNIALSACMLPILQSLKNNSNKTLFLPAIISTNGVRPTTNIGSHALMGAALANAIIELDPQPELTETGTLVKTHILP